MKINIIRVKYRNGLLSIARGFWQNFYIIIVAILLIIFKLIQNGKLVICYRSDPGDHLGY